MAIHKTELGIVDWGIGGIGIYSQIKSRLGNIPVTYFSDTGVTPYGRMSRRELISRLDMVLKFIRARGITHLVIGCNAASTVMPFLDVAQMKAAGVIESAVSVTVRLRPTNLGLLGGRRTVLSGVYRRAFAKRGISVKQRIAQPLSARIEGGDISSEALRQDCQTILSPLRKCSHVLLACTHYPAIVCLLKDYVAKETVFIDPAAELVNRVRRWQLRTGGRNTFLTTGEPDKMQVAAANAFNIMIRNAEKVTI